VAEVYAAAEAEAQQRRVAAGLRSRGLRPGDRVATVLPSSPGLVALTGGALRSGVVPVLLDPNLLPAERSLLLGDADPALVVDDAAALDQLLQGPDEIDLAPAPLGRPMLYTSGTTGRPKGVWSGVLDEAAAEALLAEERDVWGFSPGDVLLVCSPLHHSAPMRFALGTLLAGGRVVVVPRFQAGAVASAIVEHRPTLAFMVPAHLQRLFAHTGGELDLSSFRLLAHAGAPCPPPLKEQAIDAFPSGAVWEFYGSTEGQFTVCSAEEWLERPGTVGRARPGRRLTTDPDGTIWCEVPRHARFEYWRDPERTAAAWRDQQFTVGDLGRLDEDGYLFLDGRRDDLVITGGVNVYPAEVEQALARCDGVEEVAVFGVDDLRWGQRVCAAVVGETTPAAVLEHARLVLAPHKRPKEVHIVGALPRTSTGKVKRTEIPAALGLKV
jgi:long-chain acyl-CoA synthetase